MKYQLIIESETLIGLHKKLKEELEIMTQEEENNKAYDLAMSKKIKVEMRKNKKWTEWEENFLIDNYRKKTIRWIANSLQRNEKTVHTKLFLLRKKYKLPAKNNLAKTLCV